MGGPEVSIIVPTYNERENIVKLARRLDAVMKGKGIEYELVVVDDNSPDGTAEAIKEASKELWGSVKVIVRKNERGLASAVLRGFEEANGKYLIVMDADLQHPPEDIPKIVEKLRSGCDIVVASRYTKGGGIENWSMLRKVISKGATLLAWIALPKARGVSDPMSGFFGVRREVVEDGLRRNVYSPKGFKILLEIIAKSDAKKICEVPFIFRNRLAGKSKLGSKVIIEYVEHLLKLSFETGEMKRMLIFATIGAGGIVVNEGMLYVSYEILGLRNLGDIGLSLSALVGFESSVLFNFVLHDTITFKDMVSDKKLKARFKRFFHYHNASIAGLIVQVAVLLGLVSVGLHYLIANLIGIILGLGVRYSLSVLKAWG